MISEEPVEFSVDTGLFRQLGELLVGRDATALIELVKNAYDADATRLILVGNHLDDPSQASIQVIDDGTGMTALQFRRGFLRLAARSKGTGDRRSPVFMRRYTGEKGVGRLAAHKLGAVLEVRTIAASRESEPAAIQLRETSPEANPREIIDRIADLPKTLVRGAIDWDEIERAESLSSISTGLEMDVRSTSAVRTGTHISISGLRHAWDDTDLYELSRQLRTFEPPRALTRPLGRSILQAPLIFSSPRVRDAGTDDPGMELELQGDFTTQEEFWAQVEKQSDWVIEIRAARGRPIEYKLAPTRVGTEANPFAAPFAAHLPHPAPEEGPFFDARVLVRSGTVPAVERAWSQENGGVRIYLEGFRVLPYGEVGNDWLSLDLDYTKRGGKVEIDPLLSGPGDSLDELRELGARDVSLRLLPNRSFFGAVFLTEAGAGGLQTLVNREGFVPNEAYERMVAALRAGMGLFHRARALASLAQKNAIRESKLAARARDSSRPGAQADATSEPDAGADNRVGGANASAPDSPDKDLDTDDQPLGEFGPTRGSAARLLSALSSLRQMVELRGDEELIEVASAVGEAADDLMSDASLLRILASVGSQLATYTHEIAHLLPVAVAAERALVPNDGERWPSRTAVVRQAVQDLRRSIERQASTLVELSTNEARRRRSRQDLRARVEVAFLAFEAMAAAKNLTLDHAIAPGVRTPPMFRAELQAVLSNLISNAVRASPPEGVVRVSASDTEAELGIRIENEGDPVDLATAESWFLPFASTTTEVDPVLGQGMGLGLPITRDLLAAYGGRVSFVAPSPGFATAVEVVIPR